QKEKIQKQLIAQAKALPEFEILTSMPGIGELTASRIIGEVGDFTRFDNAKQINAYIGIDLRQYQSGTYRAIDHINKRGDPYARGLFYLTVANMRRVYGLTKVPNHIVDFYYRLRKKGPHPKLDKVATVACMNKLIKCLFVMIKSHQTYNYKLYHGLEAQ
ncbi:transposase, partial [Agrilactobacillus fermenti]